MAGQNAHNPVFAANDSLLAKKPSSGYARGTSRFASNTARSDPCLCVQDVLIAYFANDSVTNIERAKALCKGCTTNGRE